VLVRHRHEALVQDGQAARTRIEDADRPRVHGAIVERLAADLLDRAGARPVNSRLSPRRPGKEHAMRTPMRLVVAACTGLAALAVAGPAWASYKPFLVVTAFTPQPSRSTS